VRRVPVVGVMGSGTDEHRERSGRLGRWLAEIGVHLLTGGGKGVMSSVSEAFASCPDRRGCVIGILPSDAVGERAKAGYPNRWVEITIRTHLPLTGDRGLDPMSRNHINVLSSDVIVALPGGAGTASEVALALRYERPIIAFVGSKDEIAGLPDGVPVAGDLEEVQRFVEAALTDREAGTQP
jgi:uncharacterized protein (TIGR00725 family)